MRLQAYKGPILESLINIFSDVTQLEDPVEIAEIVQDIRKGDDGVMVAGGVTTVIQMHPCERGLRDALCDYIEQSLSPEATAAYAAYKARSDT